MSGAAAVAAPLTARAGLGAAAAGLRREPRSIAYLGASITAQRQGYRPRLHEAIRRRSGQRHRQLVAGVGGVTVVSATFLLDSMLLDRGPDFCFVDYSSADMGSDCRLEEVERGAEGIARKLSEAGVPFCFLHMPRADWDRRCSLVQAAWERVADRYGAPSIDARPPVEELVASSDASHEQLFYDGLHTTPQGSELVASLLDEAFAELLAGAGEGTAPPAPPRDCGEGPDYSRATMVPASIEQAGGAGVERRYRLVMPYLDLGVGEGVSFEPPGELAGFVVIRGPDSGEIVVSGDRGEERVSVWDEYCWYHRIGTLELARRLPAGAMVTVTLTGPPNERVPLQRHGEPVEVELPSELKLKLIGYMVLRAGE